MAKTTNKQDWLLSLSIDPNNAAAGLRKYRQWLYSLRAVSDNRSKRWINAEAKMVTKIANNVQNLKTKGPVYDTLSIVSKRLHRAVLGTWRAEMTPRTYRYLNSITISPVSKQDNVMFVAVGNWRHMMEETDMRDKPWKRYSRHAWVKPRYGLASEIKAFKLDPIKTEKEAKSCTYVASTGPLAGQTITGYWYLQEAGFRAESGIMVHHPVFSVQPMEQFQSDVANLFDKKIHTLLKRSMRHKTWSKR